MIKHNCRTRSVYEHPACRRQHPACRRQHTACGRQHTACRRQHTACRRQREGMNPLHPLAKAKQKDRATKRHADRHQSPDCQTRLACNQAPTINPTSCTLQPQHLTPLTKPSCSPHLHDPGIPHQQSLNSCPTCQLYVCEVFCSSHYNELIIKV